MGMLEHHIAVEVLSAHFVGNQKMEHLGHHPLAGSIEKPSSVSWIYINEGGCPMYQAGTSINAM
jgi:hypothetical protein